MYKYNMFQYTMRAEPDTITDFKGILMAIGIEEDKATVYAKNLVDEAFDHELFLSLSAEELASYLEFEKDDINLVISARLPPRHGEEVYYWSKPHGGWRLTWVTELNHDGTGTVKNLNRFRKADPSKIPRKISGGGGP